MPEPVITTSTVPMDSADCHIFFHTTVSDVAVRQVDSTTDMLDITLAPGSGYYVVNVDGRPERRRGHYSLPVIGVRLRHAPELMVQMTAPLEELKSSGAPVSLMFRADATMARLVSRGRDDVHIPTAAIIEALDDRSNR